jgi:hypothetical protein
MAECNDRQVREMVELSSQELEQVQGGAQVDYFLKLKGIDGEATDATRTVRVESFSWGQ